MAIYRVFTNDRNKYKGVPMYSCFAQVDAESAEEAARLIPARWGVPDFAPIVALRWPVTDPDAKKWLDKHVNAGPRLKTAKPSEPLVDQRQH